MPLKVKTIVHFCSCLGRLLSVRSLSSWNLRGIIVSQNTEAAQIFEVNPLMNLKTQKYSIHFVFQSQKKKKDKTLKSLARHKWITSDSKCILQQKSTTLSSSFELCKYFRTAKLRVNFSWNSCLKFLNVISISGHINNLIWHFDLNRTLLFLALACPELQSYIKIEVLGTWQEER